MSDAIIAAVIQKYGRYDAGLERQYIRERQRPPVKREQARTGIDAVWVIERILSRSGEWWSIQRLTAQTGLPDHIVYRALRVLHEDGHLERERSLRGCRNHPQRYLWRAQ